MGDLLTNPKPDIYALNIDYVNTDIQLDPCNILKSEKLKLCGYYVSRTASQILEYNAAVPRRAMQGAVCKRLEAIRVNHWRAQIRVKWQMIASWASAGGGSGDLHRHSARRLRRAMDYGGFGR